MPLNPIGFDTVKVIASLSLKKKEKKKRERERERGQGDALIWKKNMPRQVRTRHIPPAYSCHQICSSKMHLHVLARPVRE
jgi:hypothetical protein